MKNGNIKISIVTKTYNHAELFERLLKKIFVQRGLKNFEVITIDSSSKDNTKEIAKKYGCRIINIDPKKFSFSYTNNIGLEKARGEIVIFASVDIIPKNEFWAYNLIKHFKEKKVAGVFGKQEPIKDFNSIEEFKIKQTFPDNSKKSEAFFSSANGAIRKSIWKQIKFNENPPYRYLGGEDQKWAKQVERKGYKIIYEPLSIVKHSHNYPLKMRLYHAYMNGIYRREIEKWNEGVNILNSNKKNLLIFLIKKKKFKELFYDLIFSGILVRIYTLAGRFKRFFKKL